MNADCRLTLLVHREFDYYNFFLTNPSSFMIQQARSRQLQDSDWSRISSTLCLVFSLSLLSISMLLLDRCSAAFILI